MNEGMPIRLLSELTGVAPTTLRAWERRYQLLKPARSDKGHRLYSQQDVERVTAVVALLQAGSSISHACQQLKQQPAAEPVVEDSHWPVLQRQMLKAIEAFDERKLDSCYQQALNSYPFGLVSVELIIPTLSQLGERWSVRKSGIAEEHFFTAYLRNKLGARLQRESQRRNGALIIAACLPGESHEIGLLLFAIELLGHGYRMLYLGADLPLASLPHVVGKSGAAAVLLSGTTVDLAVLKPHWRDLCAITTPLLVGGEFSQQHRDWLVEQGAVPLGSKSDAALAALNKLVPPYRRATS